MSNQYDDYLKKHIENVKKAAEWMLENLPAAGELSEVEVKDIGIQVDIHDESKRGIVEYKPYDRYFYAGGSEEAFNVAWLHHIHVNPHHWQHWVLMQDDDDEPVAIEMPRTYVWEMVADWWSFSWASGDKLEIFDWYGEHKETMVLHERTREYVERLLREIRDNIGDNGEADKRITPWSFLLEVKPFVIGTDKEGAVKMFEEAAEAFSAWEDVRDCGSLTPCKSCDHFLSCDFIASLASELADVVQAACNMAKRYGIDLEEEIPKCEERNREKGRYE